MVGLDLHHDGRLLVQLPNRKGGHHHVLIGATAAGMKVLVALLAAQKRGNVPFNSSGAPTQVEVDRLVKEYQSREMEKVQTDLADLGIDLDTIQL